MEYFFIKVLRSLHTAYIDAFSNPFFSLLIKSKTFHAQVDAIKASTWPVAFMTSWCNSEVEAFSVRRLLVLFQSTTGDHFRPWLVTPCSLTVLLLTTHVLLV